MDSTPALRGAARLCEALRGGRRGQALPQANCQSFNGFLLTFSNNESHIIVLERAVGPGREEEIAKKYFKQKIGTTWHH